MGKPTIVATFMVMALTMIGCAAGPEYRKPSITLEAFRSVTALQARGTGTPAATPDRWWLTFHDSELTRVAQRVLHQNLDLVAAIARVAQARAAAREAGAQLLPSSSLTAQASRIHQSLESPVGSVARHLPGFRRDQSDYDVGAAASWEIDLFGGLRRAAQAASDEAEAAEASRLGTHITVVAEAADAYFQVRGDQARIALAKDQVSTDEHLFGLVDRRFRAGLATDREEAEAQALLSEARASLQPLEINLEAQLNRLNVLMGVQPGTYAKELKSPHSIPLPPAIPGDVTPAEVLRRRPDVIAAERQLAASSARIGETVAEYYPKISISGLLGFESLDAGHLFKAATYQPEAVAGLRWRLFDFGKIDAEVTQARGANAEALARYRQSILHAAEDVEDAFTALIQLEAHGEELKREVLALDRARESSERAYAAGVIPLTDVLDADRQLLSAQDQLALTRASIDQAAVRSFRAIGGGWGS